MRDGPRMPTRWMPGTAALVADAGQQAVAPPRTLLLVDDEPNILASLKRLLRRDGYHILTANGGQEGLDVLASHTVDVIVSDQRMPGMLGADFLRKAKLLCPQTITIICRAYELQAVTTPHDGPSSNSSPSPETTAARAIAEAFLLKVRRRTMCAHAQGATQPALGGHAPCRRGEPSQHQISATKSPASRANCCNFCRCP